MNYMTLKEKFLFIFLQIITLGLIWIYWKNNSKKYSEKNKLSQDNKININLEQLIIFLGNKENIISIENTHTKIKIFYKSRDLIDVQAIKNMKGISGIFLNDKFLVIIVGNSAATIKNTLINNL